MSDAAHARHLRLVTPPREPQPLAEPGDVFLLAVLAAIGAVPLAGELLGGDFGPGTLGAAAALALLSGRELLTHLRTLLRARPWVRT